TLICTGRVWQRRSAVVELVSPDVVVSVPAASVCPWLPGSFPGFDEQPGARTRSTTETRERIGPWYSLAPPSDRRIDETEGPIPGVPDRTAARPGGRVPGDRGGGGPSVRERRHRDVVGAAEPGPGGSGRPGGDDRGDRAGREPGGDPQHPRSDATVLTV